MRRPSLARGACTERSGAAAGREPEDGASSNRRPSRAQAGADASHRRSSNEPAETARRGAVQALFVIEGHTHGVARCPILGRLECGASNAIGHGPVAVGAGSGSREDPALIAQAPTAMPMPADALGLRPTAPVLARPGGFRVRARRPGLGALRSMTPSHATRSPEKAHVASDGAARPRRRGPTGSSRRATAPTVGVARGTGLPAGVTEAALPGLERAPIVNARLLEIAMSHRPPAPSATGPGGLSLLTPTPKPSS